MKELLEAKMKRIFGLFLLVSVLFIGCATSPGQVVSKWEITTADGVQKLTGICLAFEPIWAGNLAMGDSVYIIQYDTDYRLRIDSDLADWRFNESVTLNIDGNKSVYGARDWAWDREVINGDHVYESNSWILEADDLERLKTANDVKVLISGSRKSVLIQVKPEALVATQKFIMVEEP